MLNPLSIADSFKNMLNGNQATAAPAQSGIGPVSMGAKTLGSMAGNVHIGGAGQPFYMQPLFWVAVVGGLYLLKNGKRRKR